MRRKTIGKEVSLEGVALHSGDRSRVTFKPAPSGSGIVFSRADIEKKPRIKALPRNVSDTARGTTIESDGSRVSVVEHVLASVHALGITDLEIEMNGQEPPALDGSALPFFSALKEAGLRELEGDIEPLKVGKEIVVGDGEASLRGRPSDRFRISFMIDFPGTVIGRQELTVDINGDSFGDEIAPARTFGFLSEVEELKKRGLARGASMENALVIGGSGYSNKPRFKDEAVRHKILDLVGDLGLLGRPILAHVIAERSSHRLNTKLASLLYEEADKK